MRPLASGVSGLLLAAVTVAAAATEVRDDLDNRVALNAPAQRIVTLSPHATELVFAAGAGRRLIAVAPYSDYPPGAGDLPTIGGLGGVDRERLLTLGPDLVIGWASGNRPADIAWLRQTGISVYLSEPRTLDDIATNLRDIGALAGTRAPAERAARQFERTLAAACPETLNRPVIIQLSAHPLISVGGDHWLSDALNRAGLHNVLAGRLPAVAAISPETIAAYPEAHIAYLETPGNRPDRGLSWHPPIPLPADAWSRPGPRLAQAVAEACRHASSQAPRESGRLAPIADTTSHPPDQETTTYD